MHPIDNVLALFETPTLVINSTNPSSGTGWYLDHFYATGCMASRANGKPQVTCPARRTGFTCTTPAATVQNGTRFLQAAFYATRLNSNGFMSVLPFGDAVAAVLEHRWKVFQAHPTDPPRLYVSQKLTFGVDRYEAAALNLFIQNVLSASTNGDIDLVLAKVALHEIEIVGFLPFWLPRLYRANN